MHLTLCSTGSSGASSQTLAFLHILFVPVFVFLLQISPSFGLSQAPGRLPTWDEVWCLHRGGWYSCLPGSCFAQTIQKNATCWWRQQVIHSCLRYLLFGSWCGEALCIQRNLRVLTGILYTVSHPEPSQWGSLQSDRPVPCERCGPSASVAATHRRQLGCSPRNSALGEAGPGNHAATFAPANPCGWLHTGCLCTQPGWALFVHLYGLPGVSSQQDILSEVLMKFFTMMKVAEWSPEHVLVWREERSVSWPPYISIQLAFTDTHGTL